MPADDHVVVEAHNLDTGAVAQAIVDVNIADDHHNGADFEPEVVLWKSLGSCAVDVFNCSLPNVASNCIMSSGDVAIN